MNLSDIGDKYNWVSESCSKTLYLSVSCAPLNGTIIFTVFHNFKQDWGFVTSRNLLEGGEEGLLHKEQGLSIFN